MNKQIRFILMAFFSGVLSYSGPLWSETMYIDDTLLVPLRSGPGNSFRIVHKGLKSGLTLEILEKNTETGYSQIQTLGGLRGYLPTRYLSVEPIAKTLLIDANKLLNTLKKENSALKKQQANLQKKHDVLNKSHHQSVAQLAKNNKELSNIKSISANAINLDRRNRELRESNEQLRNEMELLQTENIRLKDKSESKMMLIGGSLVTLGVIIALLVPMIKPSKKGDSWA